jgi:hypothetical protein
MNIGDELRAAMENRARDAITAFLAFHKKDMLEKAARGANCAFFEIDEEATDEADQSILGYYEEMLKNAVSLHGLYLTYFYESEQGRLSFTLNWN